MSDLILYSVLTFFSVYGFISFSFFIVDFFYELKYLKDKELYIMMIVKNEACKIESVLKSLLFKVFKNDVGIASQKVILADCDSTDGTLNILKKIAENEKSLIVLKKGEIENFFDKIQG